MSSTRWILSVGIAKALDASIARAEKAEALLERIRQVAIHTPQGNAVIPSSMILEKGDE